MSKQSAIQFFYFFISLQGNFSLLIGFLIWKNNSTNVEFMGNPYFMYIFNVKMQKEPQTLC